MTTTMPADGQNQAINVLGLNPGKCHQVPFTTSEANTSPQISETISVISVFSTKDCFIFILSVHERQQRILSSNMFMNVNKSFF